MLTCTLTNTSTPTLRRGGKYHCEQHPWRNRSGRMARGSEILSGVPVYLSLFLSLPLKKVTQPLSASQFSHLQNGNPFLSMTSKDLCEVCLFMMLRMLGTCKYFLRRAGIFPLAVRREEACSIFSVHL